MRRHRLPALDLSLVRVMLCVRHTTEQVLAISFSPNGHHVATGSDDHTCRVWDLRTRKSMYTIPAHSKLISQVLPPYTRTLAHRYTRMCMYTRKSFLA